MNNSSQLFKLLAPYQGEDKNEKTPVKYAAEYYNYLFDANPYDYNELINTTKLVIANSKNQKQDLTNFVKGAILSRPYGLNKYTSHITSIADNEYTDISAAINSWLENEFRQTHPVQFQRIEHLAYRNDDSSPFEIKNSRNPSEIQKIVKETHACIKDDPLSFFEQATSDTGTIYLLAIQKDQKNNFQYREKGESNLGYIRLNMYQGEDKIETLLSVDNIFINNNNRELVCALVDSLVDLANHLDLPIIDKTMSTNYIHQNGHRLDVYNQTQNLFKLGHVPEILRYNRLAIPKDNDGFYIIKSIKDFNKQCD